MISEVCATAVKFRQAMMSLNKGYLMKEKIDIFYGSRTAGQRLRKEDCKELFQ